MGVIENSLLNRAIKLRQRVEVEKTKLQEANDRNMSAWWGQFKEMMDQFNSMRAELICINNPLLLDLLGKLKVTIQEVKTAFEFKKCKLFCY